MRRLGIALIALLLTAATASLAEEEPPARVGRVSFVEGQLAFHTTGETQWSAAGVNYPVATGGSFWTDPKSRAEIRVGSQTLSLAGDSEIDVVRLDQQVMQLALPQGRTELHLRRLPEGNSVEIDLPRGGVWLLEPGVYDIAAGSADQPTRIMVFAGSARFVGGAVDIGIKAGEAAVISGTDTLTVATERAVADAFVEWCRSRDYHPQRLAAPYYVSPAMTGYEELDQYGSWDRVPDYGEVWYPREVAADWVPYHDGQWTWIDPWGWTWVDDQPWGFAPGHYGRWALIRGRWAWIPGEFVAEPVYAPALVAFIGDPVAGIALRGVAGPAFGWFPLGPGEAYWPSYTRSATYIRNVNTGSLNPQQLAQVASVAAANRPPQIGSQRFANRGAATVVPVAAFASAARVGPAALHVAPQTLQQAPVTPRPPQVTPATARIAPARPTAAPSAAVPTAPGGHAPPAATAVAPPTGPGGHAPSAATAAPPIPPGGHPPGAATAAPPIPPGGHPPAASTATAPHAAPGGHPSAPTSAVSVPPPGGHLPPPTSAAGLPSAPAHLPPPTGHLPPPAQAPAAVANRPPPAAHSAPPAAVSAPPPQHAAPAPVSLPHPSAAAPLPPPHAAPPAPAPSHAAAAPPAPPHLPPAPAAPSHPAAAAPPPHVAPAPAPAPHPVVAAPPPAPHPAPPPPAPHPVVAAPPPAPHPAPPPPAPHPAAAAPPPAPHAAAPAPPPAAPHPPSPPGKPPKKEEQK